MVDQKALLKDRDWQVLEGDACRIVDFTPMAEIKNGEVRAMNSGTPYASVKFECTRMPQLVDGFVSHRIDFVNLTEAMKARSLRKDTEVLMFWNKKELRGSAKLFSKFMPRFCFMLCPKGAFELLTNKAHKPDLRGEARYSAMRSIMEWKPEVMR